MPGDQALLAVSRPHRVFEVLDILQFAGHQLPEDRINLRPGFGLGQAAFEPVFTLQFSRRIAQQCIPLAIQAGDAPRRIEGNDHGFDHVQVTLAGVAFRAQHGIGLLARGDVEADAGHADRVAILIVCRVAQRADPADIQRGQNDPIFARQRRAILNGLLNLFPGGAQVIAMDDAAPCCEAGRHFGRIKAEQVEQFGGPFQLVRAHVPIPQTGSRRALSADQPLVGGAQRLLGLLAGACLADCLDQILHAAIRAAFALAVDDGFDAFAALVQKALFDGVTVMLAGLDEFELVPIGGEVVGMSELRPAGGEQFIAAVTEHLAQTVVHPYPLPAVRCYKRHADERHVVDQPGQQAFIVVLLGAKRHGACS